MRSKGGVLVILLRFCKKGKTAGKIPAVLSLRKTFDHDVKRFWKVAIEATISAVSLQKEKHMVIGKFTQQGDVYTGRLYSIGFACEYVTFSPVPAKLGKGPDFVVLGVPFEQDESEFELGAAWAKTSKAGKAYLSVKLDGPSLVQPIHCALTKQQDGSHALVWNREARKDDEQSAAAWEQGGPAGRKLVGLLSAAREKTQRAGEGDGSHPAPALVTLGGHRDSSLYRALILPENHLGLNTPESARGRASRMARRDSGGPWSRGGEGTAGIIGTGRGDGFLRRWAVVIESLKATPSEPKFYRVYEKQPDG
jgi:uncharacterized protein (DUF736 family)